MQNNYLLYIGIMALGGLLFGRLVKQMKFPNVTGYLLTGVCLGPFFLKLISIEMLNDFRIVSEVALAFIAFNIGCEFKKSYFKRVGMVPIIIGLFEALSAVVIVSTALIITGHDIAFSILLGAIAAATAPAATVMIIRQYRAKGPVTDMLMSVVAIDDSIALIGFSIAAAIAKVITTSKPGAIFQAMGQSILEMIWAVIIGAILGILFKVFCLFFKKEGNRLIIAVGIIFTTSALAVTFHLPTLITCMACGAMYCNIEPDSDEVVSLLDRFTSPIYILFFVVSGAGLNLSLVSSLGITGVVYIVFRVVGKLGGAWVGAKVANAEENICKYLGPALIPQAGVAIGLVVSAQNIIPQYGQEMKTIILCATLIYEIVGPIIAKLSLKKAGEIIE
jgi:Kef-type K+ transport system membrane component KefB